MEPTLTSCVNQLGDSEAHQDNFPGDYKEWLGFQAFGPPYNLGVSCRIHSRQQQHLGIKEFTQSTP